MWRRNALAPCVPLIAEKFKTANPDNDGTIDKKELGSPAGQELLKFIY